MSIMFRMAIMPFLLIICLPGQRQYFLAVRLLMLISTVIRMSILDCEDAQLELHPCRKFLIKYNLLCSQISGRLVNFL